jgi:hypothetical protein
MIHQFAPPPPYDYHQPLPIGDSESGRQDFGDCSICMEPILVNHVSVPYGSDDKRSLDDKSALAATATNMGAVGSRVMNINFRRTYALAPCHHLFHTDCLNQWMAIKVGRSLTLAHQWYSDFLLYRTLVRFVKEVSPHYKLVCPSCILHERALYHICICLSI